MNDLKMLQVDYFPQKIHGQAHFKVFFDPVGKEFLTNSEKQNPFP